MKIVDYKKCYETKVRQVEDLERELEKTKGDLCQVRGLYFNERQTLLCLSDHVFKKLQPRLDDQEKAINRHQESINKIVDGIINLADQCDENFNLITKGRKR